MSEAKPYKILDVKRYLNTSRYKVQMEGHTEKEATWMTYKTLVNIGRYDLIVNFEESQPPKKEDEEEYNTKFFMGY